MAQFGVIDLGQIYDNQDRWRANALNGRIQQMQLEKAMKEQADQQAMADIFRSHYTPATETPVMYQPQGPMQDGSAMPAVPTGEVTKTPGKMDMSGALQELYSRFPMQALKFTTAEGMPSSVRETQWYLGQNPETQGAHMNLKRAAPPINLGDRVVIPNPLGGVRETHTVNLKPGERPEVKAEQEAATERGKAAGKASADLTSARVTAPKIIEDVESLINHPGLKYSVGGWSMLPDKIMAGTERANFVARHNKVLGTTFLQAREMLKGGGTITDFESKRAEAAIAAMDRAQTQDSYVAALRDFQQAVRDGLTKLEAQSGQLNPRQPAATSPSKVRVVDW